jgi:hypothetical protein
MDGHYQLAGVILVQFVAAVTSSTSSCEKAPVLEEIWELRNTPSSIYVRVASGGCTRAEDFRIETLPSTPNSPQRTLRFLRVTPDRCKRWEPQGTLLEFDKARLGIEAFELFRLANPFGTSPLLRSGANK